MTLDAVAVLSPDDMGPKSTRRCTGTGESSGPACIAPVHQAG